MSENRKQGRPTPFHNFGLPSTNPMENPLPYEYSGHRNFISQENMKGIFHNNPWSNSALTVQKHSDVHVLENDVDSYLVRFTLLTNTTLIVSYLKDGIFVPFSVSDLSSEASIKLANLINDFLKETT